MTQCGITDPLEEENRRLRHALLVMVTERKKMASQLTGVQNLGLQLQKKEQQVKLLSEKTGRLEGSLARAENRITQLSLQARNGQNALAGEGAIVTPGVSKKVLEALTRENTKLRQAFDHLSSRGQSGVDLAVENRDLHEIIMTLREERDMKINEVSELRNVLTAMENQSTDALQNQVMRLSTQVTKLERNLNAKQVFCETIVTENEDLKTKLQSLKDGKFMKVGEMKKELGDLTRTQPEVREIMNQVYDDQDGDQEERETSEEINKLREDSERLSQELQTVRQERDHLQEELNRKIEELTNAKKEMVEIHNAQQQLHQEEQERLRQELRDLQNEITVVGREREQLQNQLGELQMEQDLMRNALVTYENDFKVEREEKNKVLSNQDKLTRERDHVVQSYEQLKREHLSMRQNIERMYSQAQAQQRAQSTYQRQTSGRSCAAQLQKQQPQILSPRGYGLEACADGPGDDFTDAPITPPKETPKPTPRRHFSQGSQLQCPNCGKIFPHDLLENHMRDCTGDD